MRKILILVLLLLPLTAFCGNKSKLKTIPVSRWREIKRMLPDSTVVAFTDTLFMSFLRKDSFEYRNKDGFVYKGGYTINSDDSVIDFGYSKYKIAVRRPYALVLVNETGIYHLAVDESDTVATIVIKKEEKIVPVSNIDKMIGHWTVYKRAVTGSGGDLVDMARQLRSLYITGPSTDGKQGYVYGGNDADNNPSWYIKNLGADQVLDCDGKNPRIVKVIKCQGGEMILEEDGLTYYLKQFK